MDQRSGQAGGESRGDAIPGAEIVSWGPRPAIVLTLGALTLGALAWLLFATNSAEDRVVAAVVLVLLAGTTAATIAIRNRLALGNGGLAVRTPLGSRFVPWQDIADIEVTARRRLGVASSLLEIELADDDLLLFGRFDLGTDPADVAATLRQRRAAT